MSSSTILELFQEKTQFNITKLLTRCSLFIKEKYPRIIQFYSLKLNSSSNIKDLILELTELENQVDVALSILQNNSDVLDSRFWDLIEIVDELKLTLLYIRNTPKWLRSSLTKGKYSYSFENTEILKQKETLEALSTRLGTSNKDNDWSLIALRNNLREEDYSLEGGNQLTVQYFNKLSLTFNSIVDTNIVGEKVYGKDFNKKITWKDNDLDVLSYRETVEQAVDILCSLKAKDNPEFPNDGIPVSLVTGVSKNALPIPIIRRQIQQVFQKDDTLKSLLIEDIVVEGDTTRINLQVSTRINEVIEGQI